jgi:hypothetical protein
MWNFSIRTSSTLVLRTYPFMLVRMAVYFGIAAAFVVAAGGGAGIGWAFGSLAGIAGRTPGAFWGAVGGLAIVALMVWWLREYLLYLVRVGHLAALLLALQNSDAAAPHGQIGQALGLVQRRFSEIGTLSALEYVVRGSVAALLARLNSERKFPRAQVPPALNPALSVAFKHLTDAVLAKTLQSRKGPWPESRDAIVLLAQAHEAIIPDAFLLAASAYISTLVVFLLALVPAVALAQAHPGAVLPIALLFAGVFAWSFKQALIDPFVTASILQSYYRATGRQHPDAEWDAKLTDASEHFRELKARATGTRGGRRAVSA